MGPTRPRLSLLEHLQGPPAFLCWLYSFLLPTMEILLCLFPFIFGLTSSFFFLFTWSRCTDKCLLFGSVNEVKRIHTGGSVLWCWFCLGGSVMSAAVGAVMLQRLVRFGSILINPRNIQLVKVSLLWTLVAAIITSWGFRHWCNSFQVNRCFYNNEQDWHAFSPHHSDCFGAFVWLSIQTACLWLSFLCQLSFYYRCTSSMQSRHSRLK